MEIVACVFIFILQNIFRALAIIFFSKSRGRIFNELRVSFKYSLPKSFRRTSPFCHKIFYSVEVFGVSS